MAQLIERLRTGGMRTVLALVVVGLLLTSGALTLMAKGDDSTVALVNGVAITKAELFDEMYTHVGQQALDELILIMLVHEEAAVRGVTVSDEDLDAEIASIAAEVGGPEQLDFLLFQQQMTVDQLKAQIYNNLLLRALIAPEITVNDEDVHAVFEQNKDFFAQEERVRARHILVDTKEEADALRKRLVAGEDFEALAKEHSTDAGSGARGGDLGWFERGMMVAPFEQAAFALAVGDISPVVESQFGFHIIQVEERADAQPAVFDDETAAFIREQLVEEHVQQMAPTWLNTLRADADVQILIGK